MTEKRTMPWIDILKFIFAILIFLLHGSILGKIPYYSIWQAVTVRMGVPFFFVASGYFWASKIQRMQSREEKVAATVTYCKRLGIKLLVFEPISILILAAGRLVEHMAPKDILITTVKEILFYPRGALWYIQGVIVAVLLLLPFVLRKKEKSAIIPAVVLYCIALLGNRYYFLIDNTPFGSIIHNYEMICVSVRNGLFEGFPFLLCGCLIARYQERLFRGGKQMLIAVCVGFVLSLLENLFLRPFPGHDDSSLYLSYLFTVPALFSYAACRIGSGSLDGKTIVLRKLSTSIYLLHSPAQRIVGYAMGFLVHSKNVIVNGTVSAAIIAVICFVVYRYKPKPFYGWLV